MRPHHRDVVARQQLMGAKSNLIAICFLAVVFGVCGVLFHTPKEVVVRRGEFDGKSKAELREMHAMTRQRIDMAECNLKSGTYRSVASWPPGDGKSLEEIASSIKMDGEAKRKKAAQLSGKPGRIADMDALAGMQLRLIRLDMDRLPELRQRLADIEFAIEHCED
jgi:hypothetical protein